MSKRTPKPSPIAVVEDSRMPDGSAVLATNTSAVVITNLLPATVTVVPPGADPNGPVVDKALCVTCGWPVLPGQTCIVDGTVAPS